MEPVYILLAYSLDLVFGDPRWLPHPVKIMGRLIKFLEPKLTQNRRKRILRIKGAVLALAVIGITCLGSYLMLVVMKRIHPYLGIAAWIFLACASLALKDLSLHARRILKQIENKNLVKARSNLSLIVGRDTENLSEEGVIRAAVESIAEGANDGVAAPLFYLVLGGPVLALAYKAINTLDSMVGYNNDEYGDFGWFSAGLDDAFNLIPARITGIFMSAAAFLSGKSFRRALGTMRRDGKKHPSPNSGIPEAAMAGALGIRLGGSSTYKGEPVFKRYLGEDASPINCYLINEALRITFLMSILMVLTGAALKWVF